VNTSVSVEVETDTTSARLFTVIRDHLCHCVPLYVQVLANKFYSLLHIKVAIKHRVTLRACVLWPSLYVTGHVDVLLCAHSCFCSDVVLCLCNEKTFVLLVL